MTLRVVFDTNILIAAVLSPTGTPFQCTALAKRGMVQSVTCDAILDEFQEKLVVKLKYEAERARSLVQEITEYSEKVTIPNTLRVIEADPDDDRVLECAVVGNTDYIVSGDKHLLSLGTYQDIVIVRAIDFFNLVLP